MAEKKLVPELRYKGFGREWVEKRLEENYSLVSGQHLNPDEYTQLRNNGDVPYFTGPSDFTNLTEKLSKWDLKGGKIATKGDILITVKGNGVGTIFYLELDKVSIGRQLMSIKSTNGSTEFLFHKLQLFKNYYVALGSGNMIPGLSRNDILKTKISFPQPEEQQKIASFLTAVDQRIQLLQKKKAKLEEYKKGVMQKLFSQEIRFKNENGSDFQDWEEKRLGEVLLDFRLGGNYSNTEVKTEYPLIKMGNLGRGVININKIEYISSGEKIDPKDRIKENDLFFNTRNTLDLVGKVAIWRGELKEAYYNSNLMWLKFESNEYMNYFFNSFYGLKALRTVATGTTSVAAIYTKDLLKIKIHYPSFLEQQKIASFLSSLDRKIEQVGLQIEKTQSWKKGLLQKMFV